MMFDKKTTTVLLGAGASVDAGLPTSQGLMDGLLKAFPIHGGDHRNHALHLAHSAIHSHGVREGKGVEHVVDVESLYSALEMLSISGMKKLEVIPFVEKWNQHIDLREATGKNNADYLIEKIPLAVAEILSQHKCTDYLSPLFCLTENIITLNFDTTVEHYAHNNKISLSTGPETWDGGVEWGWHPKDSSIKLLKLHGSIGWRIQGEEVTTGTNYCDNSKPYMVFGQRAKISKNGPVIALYVAMSRILASTSTLVIIGYSFQDEHVNQALRHWKIHRKRTNQEWKVFVVDKLLTEDYVSKHGDYTNDRKKTLRHLSPTYIQQSAECGIKTVWQELRTRTTGA